MAIDEQYEPYSLDAEMGVLGSCLLWPERCIPEMQSMVKPKHFWRKAHKAIYSKMLYLHHNGISIDHVILREHLNGELSEFGGQEYLLSLADYAPSPEMATSYASIVLERWQIRGYEQLGKKAINGASPMELAHLARQIEVEGAFPQELNIEINDEDEVCVETEYLWEPYLPKSKGVLLEAAPGRRKTSFILSIAASLSQGIIPLTGEPCEPVKTLYIHNFDDRNEEMETVFRACGGRPGYLLKVQDLDLRLDTNGIKSIDAAIKKHNAGLIVLDPLLHFLMGMVRSTSDDMEIARALTPFAQYWSGLKDTAVWAVRHAKKLGTVDPKKAAPVSEHGIGSQMFYALFRGQQSIRQHTDPEKKNLMIFEDNKGSLLNRTGDYIIFERKGKYGAVQFCPQEINPFESGNEPVYFKGKSCAAWIKDWLADSVHRNIKELQEKADEENWSKSTIRRAREECRVKFYGDKRNGPIMLYIPPVQHSIYDPFQDE